MPGSTRATICSYDTGVSDLTHDRGAIRRRVASLCIEPLILLAHCFQTIHLHHAGARRPLVRVALVTVLQRIAPGHREALRSLRRNEAMCERLGEYVRVATHSCDDRASPGTHRLEEANRRPFAAGCEREDRHARVKRLDIHSPPEKMNI